jgi:hypothetical protein
LCIDSVTTKNLLFSALPDSLKISIRSTRKLSIKWLDLVKYLI